MKPHNAATRVGVASALLALLPACTNGINAGREGGVAFIVFTVMLLFMCLVLWIALGRDR